MIRRAFYSFHYGPDNWRASQVRNMGVIEGNPLASDNDWEQIKQGGNAAIQRWIDEQMKGKSVVIVLIGSSTANRKWINYEIEQGLLCDKGLLGIYIHGLENREGEQSRKGHNPFELFPLPHVQAYDPPYKESRDIYHYIQTNLGDWIERAINTKLRIR